MGSPAVRPATAGDVPRLREIARAAKGAWGYDSEQVEEWARSLAFPSERETWVAQLDDRAVAFAALLPPQVDGVSVLDDLWVDPLYFGDGIGTILFRHAAMRARKLGATALELEAEPNAVGFYEVMGASQVRTAISGWGRELPVMRLELG
jgi:GNAT superfamily N-acetyltransferase